MTAERRKDPYRIRDKWPGYLIAFLLIGGIIAWLPSPAAALAENTKGGFEQSIIGIGRENTYALYLKEHEHQNINARYDIDLMDYEARLAEVRQRMATRTVCRRRL